MRGVGSREGGRGGGQCSDTERSPAGPETLEEESIQKCSLKKYVSLLSPSLRASLSCEVKTAASLAITSPALPGAAPVISEAAATMPATSPEWWERRCREEEWRESWSFTHDGRLSLTATCSRRGRGERGK